jgi:predicted MFS family arabinose efflux permease
MEHSKHGSRGRWSRIGALLDGRVSGPGRRRVVVAFAAVLALDSSDKATISANAIQLQHGLGIGRPEIGLLLTVTGLVGATATIPAGVWVDRTNRTRLLAAAVASWAVAMVLSGVVGSFRELLVTRALLGAVTAVSGPAVASLLGDYFPAAERGRIYGYVLSGELIGVGFGFLVCGQLAAFSWRAPFFAMVPPTALVWWLVRRLPEPARGQQEADGDQPRAEDRMTLLQSVRWVLGVRTNVVLIAASALGYFYLSGVRGFAVEFVHRQYSVGLHVATSLSVVLGLGGLAGVLVGGRFADRLLRRGRVTARIDVTGVSILLAAVFFVPAVVTHSVWLALPLLTCAAASLGATSPPLDAARLDIIKPELWGRAEAVRTLLRNVADASAPLVFGVVSTSLFTDGSGLQDTFLVTLVCLVAAGVLVLAVGRRTYPRDARDVVAVARGQGKGMSGRRRGTRRS